MAYASKTNQSQRLDKSAINAGKTGRRPPGPKARLMNLPPLSYLLECSDGALGELELAALSRSSQHLKRAKEEWLEGAAQREIAGVARWLIENRAAIFEQARKTLEVQSVAVFPDRKVS